MTDSTTNRTETMDVLSVDRGRCAASPARHGPTDHQRSCDSHEVLRSERDVAYDIIRRLLSGQEISQTVRGPEWWGGAPGSDTPTAVTPEQQAAIEAAECNIDACPGCGAAPEVWVDASLHQPDASGRYGCNPGENR